MKPNLIFDDEWKPPYLYFPHSKYFIYFVWLQIAYHYLDFVCEINYVKPHLILSLSIELFLQLPTKSPII